MRGAAGAIAIENGTKDRIPLAGPGADDVTGGIKRVQFLPTPGPAATGITTPRDGPRITGVTIVLNGTRRSGDKHGHRIVDLHNAPGHRAANVAFASAYHDGATNRVKLTRDGLLPTRRRTA